MAVPNHSEARALITAQIPSSLRAGLEQSARENDRSLSAELRRALSEYLAPPLPGSRGPAGSRTAQAAVEARPVRDTEADT